MIRNRRESEDSGNFAEYWKCIAMYLSDFANPDGLTVSATYCVWADEATHDAGKGEVSGERVAVTITGVDPASTADDMLALLDMAIIEPPVIEVLAVEARDAVAAVAAVAAVKAVEADPDADPPVEAVAAVDAAEAVDAQAAVEAVEHVLPVREGALFSGSPEIV